MMTLAENFKNLISAEINRRNASVRSVALASDIPVRSLHSVLDGVVPSLNRSKQICDALGLELYIGPPRGNANLNISQKKSENQKMDDFNIKCMKDAVILCETILANAKKSMGAKKKAEFVGTAYDVLWRRRVKRRAQDAAGDDDGDDDFEDMKSWANNVIQFMEVA